VRKEGFSLWEGGVESPAVRSYEPIRRLLFFPFLLSASVAQPIWVEAEGSTQKSIQTNGWYSDVKKSELSGCAVLAHWGDQVGTTSYQITVPEPGNYYLWLRANPVASRLEIKVGSSPWSEVNFKTESHETTNIASDNKPDLRFLSWVKGGLHSFERGAQEIGIRFASGNNHHGMLDCFCFTTDVEWRPRELPLIRAFIACSRMAVTSLENSPARAKKSLAKPS